MSPLLAVSDSDALAAATQRAERAETRFRELNHRIANSLQIVSGFVRAQRHSVADPLAREALDATTARLVAVSRLYRHLCRDSERDSIDFARFLREIAPALEETSSLVCILDLEPCNVLSEAALHLAVLANELVLNARKHAYADRDGGVVSIGCRRVLGGRLCLTVADRGPGLPPGYDLRRPDGLGMKIVADLVRQLGGELRAENDGGARFTVLVPLPSNTQLRTLP